jgi:cytoskeleton protein RodZ
MNNENGQAPAEHMAKQRSLAELGAAVKELRESKNITLDEVSSATCIRKNFLEGIESGDFSCYKALTYARGFVRNYLNYLDAPDLWEEYRLQLTIDTFAPESAAPGKARGARQLVHSGSGSMVMPTRGFRHSSARRNLIVILCAVAAAAAALVWYNWGRIGGEISRVQQQQALDQMKTRQAEQSRYDEQRAAEEQEVMRQTAAQNEAVSDDAVSSADAVSPDVPAAEETVQKPAPETPPAPVHVPELTIRTTGSCWIRIVRGKTTLFEGLAGRGWEKSYPLSEAIDVRYGAPQNVTVSLDGKKLPLAGRGVTHLEYRADGTVRKLAK